MTAAVGLSTAALLAQSATDRSGISPWPLIIVGGGVALLSLLIVWAQNTTPPPAPEPDPAPAPAPAPARVEESAPSPALDETDRDGPS
ncbi:hypothetical protein [Pseudonocardia sp. N23]|uniref:hypothetical protein n=1 Tax=Pseudonocardia sp. N23 TaxID=1987376 RepID=UPI000BFCFD45|nr:hypothetical protein [Pseudonocardia sp. N23]GAY12601.1 hypothetical protein TOK_1089 [Pseudonocardia sp. N23]